MAETTTSFSSDQLNQQIELILDAYGIAPQNGDAELYDKITALIDTSQKKQQFFDEMVTYKTAQPNLANYQDLYNDALDFSRKQPGNYNKGTYSHTISLVNREKAAGLEQLFLRRLSYLQPTGSISNCRSKKGAGETIPSPAVDRCLGNTNAE